MSDRDTAFLEKELEELAQVVQAGPVFKIPGGKRALAPEILLRLPEKIETFYEPFVGGGAVFFALANKKRFKRAIISDTNLAFIEVYKTIRDSIDQLVEALEPLAARATDSAFFYEVRAKTPEMMVERAARTIFLSKTCYNGLYRVNKGGGFNAPFGRYTNPRVLDTPALRVAHQVLQGVSIEYGDFENFMDSARSGDAIYADPPYIPLTISASFTAYTKDGFDLADHERLARAYRRAIERGVAVVLSNADTELSRRLYGDFNIETVQMRRAINCKLTGRGKVNEILVTGLGRKS